MRKQEIVFIQWIIVSYIETHQMQRILQTGSFFKEKNRLKKRALFQEEKRAKQRAIFLKLFQEKRRAFSTFFFNFFLEISTVLLYLLVHLTISLFLKNNAIGWFFYSAPPP